MASRSASAPSIRYIELRTQKLAPRLPTLLMGLAQRRTAFGAVDVLHTMHRED